MDRNFTIEQTNVVSLEGLPLVTNVQEFLGPDGERERGARLVRLEDALALGVRFSRGYQNDKESLYTSALALTLARHAFTPIFSGSADVTPEIRRYADASLETSDNVVEKQSVSGSGSLKADWLIRDLGKLTTAFTVDAVRLVTGDHSLTTSSQISAKLVRPILRNAGFKQEKENLIQAERQLLYDLRTFTQARKDFSVQVATAYYGVLGRRDTVRNSFLNLQSSRKNAERSRALGQEGRVKQSDLGRLEQQELSAEGSWVNAGRSYRQVLDDFKLLLGLSVDANIVLDDSELAGLRILDPALSVEESIRIALTARLDYLNTKDQMEDASRKVELAANRLLPDVDLSASVLFSSDPQSKAALALPDTSLSTAQANLALDPGLDRKAERNAYRGALIQQSRASRSVSQKEDQITLQVRESWRTLDQAKRTYEISLLGVKLAERRVEEQGLLAELGRANAQDQVDAQNSLADSRNQLTQALVTHTIARLQFWNNLGILYIKENGQWEETKDAKRE
jgi:outer membrane protein TolC